MQLPWIIRGCLIAFGAATWLWASVRWYRSLRPDELLDGEIVDVRCDRSGESPTFHPTIRYRASNGEHVRFENMIGSFTPRWKAGDPVYVYLDGGVARLHDPELSTLSYLAIGLVGVVFVVVGVVGALDSP
jgi:hypothetical protein